MKMIQVGDEIPDGTIYVFENNTPKAVTVHDLCKGKKVVIFGLPGAFTAVCSSKQVPQYYEKLNALHDAGIDAVYCTSVNDAFVMHFWAKELGVSTDSLPMLADGEAEWHKKTGLTQHLPGLGTRALRYSMVVDDLKVIQLNAEEPGPTCYRLSGPDTILKQINADEKSNGN